MRIVYRSIEKRSASVLTIQGAWPMTTLHEPASRRRSRRLWLGLIGVFLVIAGYGLCWWWFVLKPLFDERRPFVGTWRLVSPSPTFPARPELVVEKDLRFDGTIIERVWDPETAAVDFNQASPARWHVSNGRYQEVLDENLVDPLLRRFGVGGGTRMSLDSPVTWEGPDRFQVQRPPPKRVTMIWSRCEVVPGLPRTNIPIGPE
jgi:hypothetical protein